MQLTETQQLVHDAFWRRVVDGEACGTRAVAKHLGLPDGTVDGAIRRLRALDLVPERPIGSKLVPTEWASSEFLQKYPTALEALSNLPRPDFEVDELPSEIPPIGELLDRREREFSRKKKAHEAREAITVRIKIKGPIGICHMGDPHVDDNGTDIRQLRADIDTVSKTRGMFGANVGDFQNNWVGRLAQIYAHQNTTVNESWAIIEWMIREIPWLYLIGGNHDAWSGSGDPLRWIQRMAKLGVFESWGARIRLVFPNGKEVLINARHTFRGNSRFNVNHGLDRAVMEGWDDHILVAGHTHSSGYSILKSPKSGRIVHTLRVAGYKRIDSYAKKEGFNDQNISPSFTTIINPEYEDDDPRLIQMIPDPEQAAKILTILRDE